MVGTRSGRFYALVYDSSCQKRHWLGTFDTYAEALAAEQTGKAGLPDSRRQLRQRSLDSRIRLSFTLEAKRELRCRVCGLDAEHLHHIVPRAAGGEDRVDNGLPLCRPCHEGWHSHRLTISRDKLIGPELGYVVQAKGAAWLDRFYPPPHGEPATLEIEALRTENWRLRAELRQVERRLARILNVAGEIRAEVQQRSSEDKADSRGATRRHA
jgi:hypothetical protein